MRRFPIGRGFGLGRIFALLFLARHPAIAVVVVVVALGVYLYRRRH